MRDVASVSYQLAIQTIDEGIPPQGSSVINRSMSEEKVENFTSIIDDDMELKAIEPAHSGLAYLRPMTQSSMLTNTLSIIRSATGLILGAQSFRNEYDGHTIEASLAQVERLTQRKIKILAGDRGYRGKKEVNGTQILIPDAPKPSDSRCQKRKKHKLFCKRAGIEPTIGHLKSDHRLGRNFYKGVAGNAVNLLLAAAAYNFKRAMRALLYLLKMISEKLSERSSMNDPSLSIAF